MIARDVCEAVFAEAIAACDPAARVREAIALRADLIGERRIGVAVGKSALAMARGIGPVMRGLIVTVAEDGGELPAGWRLLIASHPEPDERSVAAGAAVRELVRGATDDDCVVFAISGGASSLIEQPLIPLDEFRRVVAAVMAAGEPIANLNLVRSTLSAIKGGKLAIECKAPIITLAASDVVGDALEVIGSGPTIGPWLDGAGRIVDIGQCDEERRHKVTNLLKRRGIRVPAILEVPVFSYRVQREDRAVLVAALGEAAIATRHALAARGITASGLDQPLEGHVADVAAALAKRALRAPFVAFGEPTIELPVAGQGVGGRAQQLALELARHLRGTSRSALVAGTDGKDGPAPRHRPSPAGAYVDGDTWDRILAMGIDPDLAIARCDAGSALHAIDGLVITGPTGINHADLVMVG
jgi:glycerate 2-kinase